MERNEVVAVVSWSWMRGRGRVRRILSFCEASPSASRSCLFAVPDLPHVPGAYSFLWRYAHIGRDMLR